ncbi:DUF4064 domain-containing protein [Anaerovorax odorimutans]|uniref:DUF4064 domain-containing protein n=1 Tax=Anaerovorax odorimutans TaxID=109327 RepID=UPI00040A5E92|nr:DUF4064 domain-containing protein [Anaerovorax odorimutans]
MNKFQIKTRRDWIIAFIFSFLIVYLIVSKFQVDINEYLLMLTPDKISFFSQPESHGVYIVVVIIMLILSICTMIYKKVNKKYIAMVLIGGILIAGAVIASYYYECYAILKIPYQYEPEWVNISSYNEKTSSHVNYTLDENTKEQIVDKILALEPLPKDEEKTVSAEDKKEKDEVSINIWYPKSHGQIYNIWVHVNDDVIRITKGHSTNEDPMYKDNGLIEIIEKLK